MPIRKTVMTKVKVVPLKPKISMEDIFTKKPIVEMFIKLEGDKEISDFKQAIDSYLIFTKDRQVDSLTELIQKMQLHLES